MDEAEYCDRIAIIDHGQIVALDTPEALKASVGKDRVQIRDRRRRGGDRRAGASGSSSRPRCTRARSRSRVADGEQFVPRLFAELGVPIRSVSVSRPSLDDVFMSYTGTTIRDAEAGGPSMRPWLQRDPAGGEPMATARPPGRRAAAHRRSASRPGGARATTCARSGRLAARAHPASRSDRLRDRHRAGAAVAVPVRARHRPVVAGRAAATGGLDFRTFMFPGVLAHGDAVHVLFSAGSIVWDREFGFLREMLVAPVSRGSRS